eukprot:2318536-Amphidinium_carterae.1
MVQGSRVEGEQNGVPTHRVRAALDLTHEWNEYEVRDGAGNEAGAIYACVNCGCYTQKRTALVARRCKAAAGELLSVAMARQKRRFENGLHPQTKSSYKGWTL